MQWKYIVLNIPPVIYRQPGTVSAQKMDAVELPEWRLLQKHTEQRSNYYRIMVWKRSLEII